MSSRIAAVMLCGTLLLSGCAVAPHQPLKAELRDKIGTTEVVVRLPQREINAQIVVSNVSAAVGGGLIAALVDAGINSSRTSSAETTVAPLRDALLGYNFDESLRTTLDSGLSTVPKLSAQPARVMKDSDDSTYAKQVAASSAGAVLLASADYSLSADFSTAEVGLRAWLMPRSVGLRSASGAPPELPTSMSVGLSEALYRNSFVVRTRLQNADRDQVANRGRWVADGAQTLRQALDTGIRELVAVLVEDMNTTTETAHLGPAVTSGYSRKRAVDGTITVAGRTGTIPPIELATVPGTPAHELAAQVSTPSAPPPPPTTPASVTVARIEGLVSPQPTVQAATPPPLALDLPILATPNENPVQPPVTAAKPVLATAAPVSTVVEPTSPEPIIAMSAMETLPASSTNLVTPPGPMLALLQPLPVPEPESEPRYDWRTRDVTILRMQPTPGSVPSSKLASGAGLNVVGKIKNMTGEWFYMQAANDTGWVRSTEIEAAQ